MRRKRVGREVYGVDVSRYSVYPQAPSPGEEGGHGSPPPRPGSIIRVRLSSMNDDGVAVGKYRDFTVLVAGAEPGETVEAVVEKVEGDTIHARVKPARATR